MADYTGLIRVGIEGLGQIRQLNTELERTNRLINGLEGAEANVRQAGESASRNVAAASRGLGRAIGDMRGAGRARASAAQRRDPAGKYAAGGGTMAQRRLANQLYTDATDRARAASRNLREEQQNRRLIAAAEGRYARAINRAANIQERTGERRNDQELRNRQTMQGIGSASRGNYLTNLFQGRQREFARGGGGAGLSQELQQQARNVRGAWDLATAGGRENLQLMQRIATEMAGLLRQQNELNRGRAGRSIAFEAGRRGQERITDLSRMQGANPGRIRGLRSQATEVISASNLGDIAGSREATRRMNASIGRYERELNGAARELSAQQRAQRTARRRIDTAARAAGGAVDKGLATEVSLNDRTFNDRLRESKERAKRESDLFKASSKEAGKDFDQRLQNRVRERQAEQRSAVRDLNTRSSWQKALSEMEDRKTVSDRERSRRFREKFLAEEKRQADLGIGVNAPTRIGGPVKRTGAIPMGGQGGRQGMFNQYASLAGPGNPIGIGEFQRIQKAQREQQRQQGNQKGFFQGDLRSAIGDALIGGAFPALFGQGLGASAGGAVGGLAGGAVGGNFGFGLSLVGTAIGQVVDTTIGKLGSLGDALGSASDSIKGLEDAGFRVRDSQKVQIAQLEKVGRGYDAQAVALKEVESRLGPGSVAQIEKLNEAQKQLSDSWAALSLQLGVSLIPVVAEAASLIADLFGRSPGGSGSGAAPKSTRPRKPSEVLADIDASIALNQTLKAGNREYASLVRDAEDWRRDNEDKIFQMRRQGVDIEKQKSDLRLDVENKIFDMRQQAATLEADNTRARAQLAINSFGLGLDRRADAIGGRAGDFIAQVREYLQARDQGESELQAKEKTAKLQIAANERSLQQYILQVSDKVASIARTVEDYKRDQEKFRFESSRRIEDYRIKAEDYIYSRVKDRYEYAIGSEQEILRIKMEAAAALGAALPADAGRVLSGTGPTAVGMAGLANPLGAQSSGRAPNWNQGLGAGRGHQGQDIGVDVGTTIHAIEDAVVEGIIKGFSRDGNPRAGDAVMLRYLSGQLGVYGHIKPLSGIAPGQRVKAGQQIGTISDWGDNSHLHYELWKRRRGAGGELLDPTERLRSAMSGRRARPPMPATSSQRRSGPAMLLPGVTGPALQPSAPATTDSMFDRRQSSARPGIGDQFISLLSKQGGFEDTAGPAIAQKRLPTYAPAPLAPPTLPASPQLPASPAPMAMPDIKPLATELRKQNSELLQSVQLANKLEQVENGRLLLQLSSTREVRDRLEDATKELALESKIAELGKSLSDNDQSRAVERTRTAFAAEELNRLEQQSLGFANELLQKGKLQKEEYDSITRGLRERIGYEKDLLQVAEDRAEVARQEAFNQRSGEIVRETRLVGAGLRAGRIGAEARAFEEELRLSGDVGKANQMADNTKRLEDQRLVWANLEKDIVSVSDAISGALTNGLVDIVSGARSIQDVGRDMLNSIAGSFADSAQQQLGNLMQRQLGGLLGGQQGPLVKMLGAGAEAAGPQALGAASMVASGQVAAFGMALQTVAAQMAFSSALGGGSALSGVLGSAVSGAAPNLFGNALSSNITDIAFGGFLANGGTAQAGKGYVVGEKEPEFFFPGVTGRVVPRSDMEKAAALGQSGGQADPLELDYTVTERQGERMVTEEQMRRNNALLLKQAQARTLASMRNNKEVRDFVNI
jgi:murein DD-endopeptidase MepM/ murein hydrolase activator NlpD